MQVCMMIYVFGDLRQLRSFELARVPGTDHTEPAMKEKQQQTTSRRSTTLKLFSRLSSAERASALGRIQPLIGPPLMQQSALGDSTLVPQSRSDASCSMSPRLAPPKLHIVPPAPAHTARHIHTSARAHHQYSSHSHSLASTSYSVKFRHPGFCDPRRTAYDTEDDCTVSGSEYESEYDSATDSDVSTEESDAHVSETHEGTATTDVGLTAAPHGRRRSHPRHRRRRREPEIHISDAIFDEDPSPEGPAMGEGERRRSSTWGGSSDEDVGMGATFIHPFRWDDADE